MKGLDGSCIVMHFNRYLKLEVTVNGSRLTPINNRSFHYFLTVVTATFFNFLYLVQFCCVFSLFFFRFGKTIHFKKADDGLYPKNKVLIFHNTYGGHIGFSKCPHMKTFLSISQLLGDRRSKFWCLTKCFQGQECNCTV